MEFSFRTRKSYLEVLANQEFDVLVIGGGITGAGIAREAALRGYSVALIEQNDFGSGTSSRSSKLIHGGFRYMAQFHFGLVHEALVERFNLMQLAPHLVHPQPFLLPIYRHHGMPPWMIHVGLLLYDWLTFGRNIGNHKMIPVSQLPEVEPLLSRRDLKKAALYFDAKVDDFRLVLATIKAAAMQGAPVVNYVQAVKLTRSESPFTVKVQDRLTGETFSIRARSIANASGPWCDEVYHHFLGERSHHVRPTKGVHIIIPHEKLPIQHAVTLFAVQDKRPIFAIPFQPFVLLGTTDTDFPASPETAVAETRDVDYLLTSFNHYFPDAKLQKTDILSAYAGVRPLIFEKNKRASEVSREHQIFQYPRGMFSIIGGKLTTFRIMARDMVSVVGRYLQERYHIKGRQEDLSMEIPLWGGRIHNWEEFYREYGMVLQKEIGVTPEVARHLLCSYGSDVVEVVQFIRSVPDGANNIHPQLPYVWGEVDYQLNHEMAVTLPDFLVRRTHIYSLDVEQGKGVLPAMIHRIADSLEWSEARIQTETEHYLQKLERENQWRSTT